MMKKDMKRGIVCILVLILIIPVFIWCGALAKNFVLTVIHKDKIEKGDMQAYVLARATEETK